MYFMIQLDERVAERPSDARARKTMQRNYRTLNRHRYAGRVDQGVE